MVTTLSAVGEFLRSILRRDHRFIFGDDIPNIDHILADEGLMVSSDLTRATDLLSMDITEIVLYTVQRVFPQVTLIDESIKLLKKS